MKECTPSLKKKGYGKSADWWSVGALFFELLCGNTPFASEAEDDDDKTRKLVLEKNPVIPDFVSYSSWCKNFS